MTSPRRKGWLFDPAKLWNLITDWRINKNNLDLKTADEYALRIEEFIDSDIKRNIREFAEKLKYQEFDYDHERFNQRIEAAFKEIEA